MPSPWSFAGNAIVNLHCKDAPPPTATPLVATTVPAAATTVPAAPPVVDAACATAPEQEKKLSSVQGAIRDIAKNILPKVKNDGLVHCSVGEGNEARAKKEIKAGEAITRPLDTRLFPQRPVCCFQHPPRTA